MGVTMGGQYSSDRQYWTYFAPPERASEDELWRGLLAVRQETGVMQRIEQTPGLAAVLNEQRQVLAVNHAVLASLGIECDGALLGLRPGEALGCIHSAELPGGCGTSQSCTNCGAVIAILACLAQDIAVEGECTITVERLGLQIEMVFQAACTPLVIDGRRFLLLSLHKLASRVVPEN